ncbi:MAG: capsular biosynthesis protein, partial [Cyanobacteria bacterium J06648_1]
LSTQQNPSRLLASGKMSKIIEKLRESFDLVIYDLCAIVGFADVNLLAKKTDGIIVVTGLGKIQTAALNEALSQLKLCQAPTLGVAINKIK